ncbi:MAG: hypothetical protein ACYC5O_10080 [Anaerolineae bacterium]
MPLFGLLKPSWARGAADGESLATAFISAEVPKAKPDVTALTKALSPLAPEQRAAVWNKVGLALKQKGDATLARQCFVEAVFNDPDSASLAWAEIVLPPGMAGADPLRSRLSALPRRPISGDRPGNQSLAVSLRRLVGEPGQS